MTPQWLWLKLLLRGESFIESKLDQIIDLLRAIQQENRENFKKMATALEDLHTEVAAVTTSVGNAIAASTAAITAAIATNDTAAIEAEVTNLKNVQATLDTFTASLTTATPPAPPAAV